MPGVYYIIVVMKNKILILLMSCNQPLYNEEEQACRDTFLKDAENAGISYYFYKGINDEHPTHLIDEENHTMYLPVSDGLGGTSRKTVYAMGEALRKDDWDYLIKTNVSTWLDIKKIIEALDGWDGRGDTNIYGARYLANDASKKVPFPRGHFVVLSRELVKGIVQWSPKLIGADGFPKTDDTLISLSLLYHIQKVLGSKYQDKLLEVPSIISWTNEIQDAPEWSDALSIRCKDEKTPTNTPKNMRKVNTLKRAKKVERNHYRPIGPVETKFGLIPYHLYEVLEAHFKKLTEKKEQEEQQVQTPPPPPPPQNKLDEIRKRLGKE